MSLLKKMFDTLEQRLSVVSKPEDMGRIVSVIREDRRIRENIPISKILNEYQKYPKLGFGIESAIDREKLLEKFQIRAGELVIAIVKGKGTMLSTSNVERVVLTDKALYTHPSIVEDVLNKKAQLIHCDNVTNRFPIDEFCKYILYAPDKYNAVIFENEAGVFVLDKKSVFSAVFSKNEEAMSLYNMLKDLQNSVYSDCEQAREDRKNVKQWLYTKVEEQLSFGCLDEHTSFLVECFREEDALKCGKILWENALHLYDSKLIDKRIRQVSTCLDSRENTDKFLKEIEICCCEFLSHLQQVNHDFHKEYWRKTKVSRSIFKDTIKKEVVDTSSIEGKILQVFEKYKERLGIYIAVRKFPETDLKIVEGYLERYGDVGYKNEIFKLMLCIRNQKMKQVFDAIRNNERIQEEWCEWTDGYGLTALHYAILLNNRVILEEIVEILAKKQLKRELPANIDDIYDYGALCMFAGRTEYINDIAIFSRETQPLINSKKKMQFMLKVKQVSYNAQNKGLRNFEAAYRRAKNSGKYEREQLEKLEKEISETREHLHAFYEDIEALKADIDEIENEIYKMGKILSAKYNACAERIRREAGLSEKLLKCLYMSSDSLYNALGLNETECKLHCAEGVYFTIPNWIFVENKKESSSDTKKDKGYQEEWAKKKAEKASYKKPYGNNWFSPEAHADVNVLRKEYHKLAAKFHPDNNPDGVESFLEIQKERESILNNLKEG